MSNLRGKRLLDKYIASYGVELPKDWMYYTDGNIHEHECTFCSSVHNANALYRYFPERDEKFRENLHCYTCDECQQAIDINLIRAIYPEYMDMSKEPDEREHRFHNSEFEDEEFDINARNHRIALFNTQYKFDATVHSHYGHLKLVKDKYIIYGNTTECYFCKRGASSSPAAKIRTPVLHELPYLSGGKIKSCGGCKPLLKEELLSPDLLSIHQVVAEACRQCAKHYLIDEREAAYRNTANAQGEYLCPECAYEAIDKLQPSSFMYMYDNEAPRTKPMLRFKTLRCEFCLDEFELDLTLDFSSLLAFIAFKESAALCRRCRSLYPNHITKDSVVYWYSNTVCAVIYPVHVHSAPSIEWQDFWGYDIVELNAKSRTAKVSLKTPEEVHIRDLAEAVCVAASECRKLVVGEQLKIWGNEI